MMTQDLEEQIQFRAFRTQIKRTMEGFGGYRESIQSVTIEAKRLSERSIEVIGVSRESFTLVTHLASKGKDFLSQLPAKPDLAEREYNKLLEIFSVK